MTQTEKCSLTIRGVEGGEKGQPGRIKIVGKIFTDMPSREAASAGIAPNYIHSQDASHMAIVIDHFGTNFGAVHDSFSCHASDVDRLKTLTQQVFVEMYRHDNPLDTIKKRITGQAYDKCDVEVPELGALEINQVIGSRNFFA